MLCLMDSNPLKVLEYSTGLNSLIPNSSFKINSQDIVIFYTIMPKSIFQTKKKYNEIFLLKLDS